MYATDAVRTSPVDHAVVPRVRRSVALLAALFACALGVQLAFAASAFAAACNDNWTNAAGGSWSTPGNWDNGIPGANSDACITLPGNYTVSLVGSPGTIHSLTLGASSGATTQTLAVQGVPGQNSTLAFTNDSTIAATGKLVLDTQSNGGWAQLLGQAGSPPTLTNHGMFVAQVEGTNLNYLDANLTIAADGMVEVKSGELRQDAGTTTTNSGTFKVDTGTTPGLLNITNGSASFLNDAGGSVPNSGSIALSGGASWSQVGGSETGNPVTLNNTCSLTDNGAGSSGKFDVIDTVSVSGTLAAGETLRVLGAPGHNSVANVVGGLTSNGTIVLDSQASGGYADLAGNPVTNNGTLETQVEGGSLTYLEASLTNHLGATVEVKSGELRQDQATTTTNDGTFKTDAGASPGYTITSGGASFVNNGSVSNGGAITLSSASSWSQHGGSETGNPVTLNNTSSLTDTGTGSSGKFNVIDAVSVSGTIASGETLSVLGAPGHNSTANLASATVTNNGTIVLDSQLSGGYANITGSPLINNGSLDTQVEGGSLTYLEVNLTNHVGATVEVKSGELRQDGSTTTTNDGTFKTDAGASPGYTITSGGGSFVNNGSVSNGGAITLSAGSSWSQHGGSETGAPVSLFNSCSLVDAGTGTSGAFNLFDNVAVSGTIAAGETVSVLGAPGHNSNAALGTPSVMNNGTIVLDSQAAGGGWAQLNGGTLINNGTLNTQVEGGSLDYLEANLTNNGTVEVKSGALRQDQATTTTNHGNVILDVPGQFNLTSGGAVFNQQADGTMTFDISGPASFGTLNLSGGATFNLNGGTAKPVLQGGYKPAVGTEFDVITGPHGAGTFTTVTNDFTGDYSNPGFIGLVRDRDSTTTSVTSSLNPSTVGQSVKFTATVTPGPGGVGNPTGTVTFFDNGVSIGTGSLSTTGGVTTATLTTSSLDVGTHPITASYAGDSNYKPSPTSSPALNQVVNKDSTSTTLTSSHNPSIVGQSVKFTATVSPGTGVSGNPTGTVTFRDNGVSIGTGSLSTTGGVTTATLTTSSLDVGTHPITASYGGDSNHATSSSSPPLNQVVNKDGSSTTLTSSRNPSTAGQSVTFTATVSSGTGGSGNPTGTVTFFDNGVSIGTGSLSTTGGVTTATLTTTSLDGGTHPITASYGGDANHANSSSSPPLSQVVNKDSSRTTIKNSINPSAVGQSVTFTATVSSGTGGSGNPTGTVTFRDNGVSIGTGSLSTTGGVTTATLTTSSLALGTHPITASYGGDVNHATSSSPTLNHVVKVATRTALKSSANPSTSGQSVTFTATISSLSGGAPDPTGTVTFRDNGVSIGTGAVSTTGGVTTATFTTSSLALGTHPITALYGGDGSHGGSLSNPALNQVVKVATRTALKSSANPSTSGQSVTFTATISSLSGGAADPTGTVTFRDNGVSIGTGAVSTTGGVTTATFTTSSLAAGTHPITAFYGGDGSHGGSLSNPPLKQVVNPGASRGHPARAAGQARRRHS